MNFGGHLENAAREAAKEAERCMDTGNYKMAAALHRWAAKILDMIDDIGKGDTT